MYTFSENTYSSFLEHAQTKLYVQTDKPDSKYNPSSKLLWWGNIINSPCLVAKQASKLNFKISLELQNDSSFERHLFRLLCLLDPGVCVDCFNLLFIDSELLLVHCSVIIPSCNSCKTCLSRSGFKRMSK